MKALLLAMVSFLQLIPSGMCACQLGLRPVPQSLRSVIDKQQHESECCCSSCRQQKLEADPQTSQAVFQNSSNVPACPDNCPILRDEESISSPDRVMLDCLIDSVPAMVAYIVTPTAIVMADTSNPPFPQQRSRLTTLQKLTI